MHTKVDQIVNTYINYKYLLPNYVKDLQVIKHSVSDKRASFQKKKSFLENKLLFTDVEKERKTHTKGYTDNTFC